MTTIAIRGNMHTLIIKKQQEIRYRYKMYIRISDIVTVIIKNGIDNIETLLGLGKEGGCIKRDKFDIINMANKVNIEIIYTKENIDDLTAVPACCGTYIITTESGRIYIGASSNIYNRIMSHNIEESIRSVDIYITRNKNDAILLERYLIYELNPEINIQRPMSPSPSEEIKTVQIEDKLYFSIIDKQREILKKHGVNIATFQIVDILLKNYIDKIEKLFHIKVENINMTNYVNMSKTIVSKTVPLHEDVHALIVDKQRELKIKHNITIRIIDLITLYVKDGIDRTEELLGLRPEKESDNITNTGIDKNY